MAWFTGGVALALMLAILEIDPNQLAAINGENSYQQWQTLSYGFIFISLSAWMVAYFRAHSQSHSKPSHPTQINFYLPPLRVLKQQGIIVLLAKVMAVVLFWLAVMSQGLAQRIQAIEQSPAETWYIQTTVTPLGLSDKRLERKHSSNTPNNNNNNKKSLTVEEDYRQLVSLTDITWYKRLEPSSSHQQDIATNPFTEPAALEDNDTEISDITAALKLPKQMTVMLQSYKAKDIWLNEFSADKTVRLALQLSPIELTDNPDEFNEYRWLSSRHATAKAKLMTGDNVNQSIELVNNDGTGLAQWIDRKRFDLRQHFLQLMAMQHAKQSDVKEDGLNTDDNTSNSDNSLSINPAKKEAIAVTLSLLTGDRSLISQDMTGLYRFAGISHLLAISGTHVLFLAMLCASLITALINRFRPSIYEWLPRWQCAFVIGVVAAFAYAAFAGFDVPAVRTACMLLLIGILRYFLAISTTFKVLLSLAVAMAWWDVFVLWQAGFWLSFIAVAVLFVYAQRWGSRDKKSTDINLTTRSATVSKTPAITISRSSRIRRQIIDLFKLQMWISVALLPISLWLFGKVSLWGFVVNLFAIGLFGWIIVPLNLLAGMVYTFSPTVADRLWSLLFWILSNFHTGLFWLQETAKQVGWIYTDISLPILLLILLIALPWMLPQRVLSRLLSIPALLLLGFSTVLLAKDTTDSIQIIPINLQDSDYFAVIVRDNINAWLLLSAYASGYQNKASKLNDNALFIAPEKAKALSQAVYEQLKEQQLSQLTGVIVQTATPKLAAVVADLRKFMPISYYWQAGLSVHESQVTKVMQGTRLQAQDCLAGTNWQAIDRDKTSASTMNVSAVTGWSIDEDKKVADCTIMLDTPLSITLVDNPQQTNIIASHSSSYPTVSHLDDIINSSLNNSTLNNNNFHNRIIIYTSAQPRLAALWQLQCAADIKEQPWITSPQAQIDKSSLNVMQPLSWRIIDEQLIPINSQLKQTHLYWYQSIKPQ